MKTSLDKMLSGLAANICEQKLASSHKMTDTQKKLWKAHLALLEKAKAIKATADTARKKFWNKVEADLENFDDNLKVNEETWEIEVFVDADKDCDKDTK